jgi:hypothetical protein
MYSFLFLEMSEWQSIEIGQQGVASGKHGLAFGILAF